MTRRMTLLVLALLGVMVLVVTLAPPDSGVRNGSRGAAPQAAATAGLTDPDAFDVEAKLSAEPGEKAQMIEAQLGDKVQIVVEGSQPASVQLGDMSTEQLEQGGPARFQWLADTPGAYPLVLVDENRRIGTLDVR